MKELSNETRNEYARIAHYYYKAGLTQEQIAEKTNFSRQKVNRILARCVELGIVQIHISQQEQSFLELETRLEEKYDLKAVRIAGHVTEDSASSLLGAVAARYLSGMLQDGDIIGFSRGRAMSALARNLTGTGCKNLRVTQLMGSSNSQHPSVNVDDIVHRAAESLNASTTMLYAPTVVNKRELRKSIMSEPYFREAYEIIRSCTVAAVGIGGVSSALPNEIPSMDGEEYRLYCEKRAVGEICAHFFDREGSEVRTDFDERTIVIRLEDFLAIPLRMGVAGLPSKLTAIEGALNGKYINVLITDLDTAERLGK